MRNSIIGPLTSNPKGLFLEGVIDDTSLPGTCMELVPQASLTGLPLQGGRSHWRHYQPGADGDQRQVAILLEDDLQGATFLTPYVAGRRCRMYVPALGEEINVLAAGQQGTGSANEYDVGDRLIPATATGQFILQTDATKWAPFKLMEEITITADVPGLVWVIRDN